MLAKILGEKDTNNRIAYKPEIWIFGCYCNGPCRHSHGRLQEWFWNTDRLYPALLKIWHIIVQDDDFC